MTLERAVWAIALLAIVVAGTRALGGDHDRAEAAEARADSLYTVAVRAETELASTLAREAVLVGLHTAERDSALARAERAERRRPQVIERVVEAAGPDSAVVRAAVRQVVDLMVLNNINPLRRALAAADSVGASRARQRDAALAANAALQVALDAAIAEGDAWRAAARPTLLGFHVEPETAALVGLGLGLLVSLR